MADPKDKDETELSIVWEVPTGFPTHYATHLVAQHSDEDFTITFWDLRPPVLMGSPDEKSQQVKALKEVRPTALARIVVTPRRMREFVQVMQDNLKTFEETAAERAAKEVKR
jgi:hypothetical protein